MIDPTKRDKKQEDKFWRVFHKESKQWQEEFEKLTGKLPPRSEDPELNIKNIVIPCMNIQGLLNKKYPNFAKGVQFIGNS